MSNTALQGCRLCSTGIGRLRLRNFWSTQVPVERSELTGLSSRVWVTLQCNSGLLLFYCLKPEGNKLNHTSLTAPVAHWTLLVAQQVCIPSLFEGQSLARLS